MTLGLNKFDNWEMWSNVKLILSICLVVNSIMQSIVFIILLSYIHITIQQQCPINQISIDGKKCSNAETPSLIGKSYSDAEIDCKQRAANVGSDVNRTFLVSISNAIENNDVIGR